MLDESFAQVYTKFKLHFYQAVFSRFQTREATLSAVETFHRWNTEANRKGDLLHGNH